MSGSVSIRCPDCQQLVRLRGSQAVGKRVRCPRCGQSLDAAVEQASAVQPDRKSNTDESGANELDEGRLAFEREAAALDDELMPSPAPPPPTSAAEIPPAVAGTGGSVQRDQAKRRKQPPGKPLSTIEPRGEESRRAEPKTHAAQSRLVPIHGDDVELPLAPPRSARSLFQKKQGAPAFVEVRKRRARDPGFWSVNRVSGTVGTLVALFCWAWAATLFTNAICEVLSEDLEDGAGPMLAKGFLIRPRQVGFVFNAVFELPNVFHVCRWTFYSAPWLIFCLLFGEGLVLYFWLASRALERNWADADDSF